MPAGHHFHGPHKGEDLRSFHFCLAARSNPGTTLGGHHYHGPQNIRTPKSSNFCWTKAAI
ncbi:hypothetical protein CKAH01_10336 [Colletotrichum kahawae]|uniref:Uncharacterized protein n=1 Tax=Colletotrichum kahawae TaxID=34407 RepID=A0AAD9XXH8_COLKA|nr:hypothetical protein CKAH01_10336 [Colletotrichum kahawae]